MKKFNKYFIAIVILIILIATVVSTNNMLKGNKLGNNRIVNYTGNITNVSSNSLTTTPKTC